MTLVSSYYFQAKAFSRIIGEGIEIRTPASDGVLNMQVVDEIYRTAGLPLRGE